MNELSQSPFTSSSSFYKTNEYYVKQNINENKVEETTINYDLLNSRITEHEEYVSKQKLYSSLPFEYTNDVTHKNELPVYTGLENSSCQTHMIQERLTQPYIDAFPTTTITGIMNPLRKKVINTNLNIDSRFRDNYYGTQSTNFNINLPMKINKITSMQLSAIELPNTFYTISKNYDNNFFSITANTKTAIINIPEGGYSADGLIGIINTELKNLGSYFQYVIFSLDYNSGSGSGRTIVGISPTYLQTNPVFPITLNFQTTSSGSDDRATPLPLKFGWLLGFRNGLYINNSYYVSEGVLDLFGPKYLFLCVDDFNNSVSNNFYSAFNSSMLNKNILARISLKSGQFTVLQENDYNLVTTPREYFGPVDIQRLNIQLLDEYGRVINLNGSDFSFCITLQTVYDI
jgi:hypothetical protein